MSTGLKSLIDCGTTVWLDTIDPHEVRRNIDWGVTGATSNPKILTDLIRTGRFDDRLPSLMEEGMSDEDVAWHITDELVTRAEEHFRPVWERTDGNDGYVSFELDPLLDDPAQDVDHKDRVKRYIALGKRWSAKHPNRLIKVPATPAGIDALEDLVAAGVNVNVTLCFTERQYREAREAIWRGAQRRVNLDHFKSVYSIFVSRVDVFASQKICGLSEEARGLVGIVNAKRLYQLNDDFWPHGMRLTQDIVFASTGPKLPGDEPDKYVSAFAGGGVQTNPPEVNERVQQLGRTYEPRIEQMPTPEIVGEIMERVEASDMEAVLMDEGVAKFAEPFRELLDLIARKRSGAGVPR